MRVGRRRYGDRRLLFTALSSCVSIGSFLQTRFRKFYRKWRTLMRNSSFLAKKTPILTQARSFFRLVALKRHKDGVIRQDKAEKTPTYTVGGIDSIIAESGYSTADPVVAHERPLIPQDLYLGGKPESGEPPQKRARDTDAVELFVVHKSPPAKERPKSRTKRKIHPKHKKIAQPAKDLLKTSGEDLTASLKRKASTSEGSQPVTFPPAKRPAAENMSAPSTRDLGRPEPGNSQVEMAYTGRPQNNLSPQNLSILKSSGQKGMLDDDIINKAQELLQNQFEDFDGLQPAAALLIPGYCVLKKAVQIHYDEDRVHWLTTCFKDGNILVADSIKTNKLPPSICEQICNIYGVMVHEPLKHLTFLDVDQQRNSYDCGVFAIAFAFEFLTDDGDPIAIFQHQMMREHLISCLQNGRITGFPKKVN